VLRRRLPPLTGPDPAGVTVAPTLAAAATGLNRRTLPYNLLVHCWSHIALRAELIQSGYEPGARVMIIATLTASGLPAAMDARAWVEIVRPDGSTATLVLAEREAGRFEGGFTAAAAGVYRCRVRASARSGAGYPFQREQTLTAAVWLGGDRDADPGHRDGGPLVHWLEERDEKLCALLRCLLAERGVMTPEFRRRIEAAGMDLDQLRRCLDSWCRPDAVDEGDVRDVPRSVPRPGRCADRDG
jgi:hypothetical protein